MLPVTLRQFRIHKNKQLSAVITVLQNRNNSTTSEPIVVRSKIPDIAIPNVLIDEYLWNRLDKWHDRTIVECAETGRSYTYAEIYNKSRTLANYLHKSSGLKQGDTVAIILPNVPEYPVILLAAIQAGLKTTLINPTYTTNEIARQLQDSETKLVFTLNGLSTKTAQAVQSLSSQKTPMIIINHTENEPTPFGTIKFKDVVEGDHNLSFKISLSYDDVIIMPYSSGTTGLPKGVELTNRNIVSNLAQMAVREFAYIFNTYDTHQDVVPAILPMFHSYGLMPMLLTMMSHGVKMVTIPKFKSKIFIDVLEKHKPNLAIMVPPIIMLMINDPNIQPSHIARFQAILSGAAPLGAVDIEKLQEKSQKQIPILQGYGLTETSPTVFNQTEIRENGIKLGGSGFSVPNTEYKIISLDNENKTLGPNQAGELLIRGPQVMKAYHNNPKATSEVLDSNGWLRTGDIGYYDEDEHFFITGRLKELIKVKGFQVAPAELEELLRDHPDVEDVAVVGVPHAEAGEVPKAFIIRKKDSTIDSAKLQEYLSNKVAKHKQLIGGVVFVDDIPKNSTGKILRRVLQEM